MICIQPVEKEADLLPLGKITVGYVYKPVNSRIINKQKLQEAQIIPNPFLQPFNIVQKI